MKKIFFCWLFLLTTTGVAAREPKREKMAAAIRRVMAAQVTAWNQGDIIEFMRGYWQSPDLVFVSGATVTRGWQPTLDRYQQKYASRAQMGTLTFSDVQVTVLSKNAATVLGSWALAREPDRPHGKFTLIFRKFKDGWRIVHDHTS